MCMPKAPKQETPAPVFAPPPPSVTEDAPVLKKKAKKKAKKKSGTAGLTISRSPNNTNSSGSGLNI